VGPINPKALYVAFQIASSCPTQALYKNNLAAFLFRIFSKNIFGVISQCIFSADTNIFIKEIK
jgi:hypothetical protein